MNSQSFPTIQHTRKIGLNRQEEGMLQHMFGEYGRLAVEAEFGTGYSGCRVLRVRPIEASGVAHRPELCKIGPIGLINEEWQAYDSLVRTTLPRIAWVTSAPLLVPETGWGGLRYELVGAGIFEVQSLSQYYRQASTEDLLWVLQKRLFPVMSRSWWSSNRAESAFQFRTDYDHLLPVNLKISATESLPDEFVEDISSLRRPAAEPKIGTRVRLQDFMVVEVEAEKGQLTLNHPQALDGRPFESYRLRLEGLVDANRFQVGEIIESLYGIVVDTRSSMVIDHSRDTLGEYVNLAAKSFRLSDDLTLPNPLLAYRDLLSMFHEVNLSTVHGDLNLENVLIDPETRDVKLIDFASVRTGHNLHDLLRLETGVLTVLLPETLAEAKLPPPTIAVIYRKLDQSVFRPDQGSPIELPHSDLEKPYAMLQAIRQEARKCLFYQDDPSEYYAGLILYLLGALKFKSLDDIPGAKEIAFLGAAAALEQLEPASATVGDQAAVDRPFAEALTKGLEAERSRTRSPWFWAGVSVLSLITIIVAAVLIMNTRSPPLTPIDALCEIEESLTTDIANGPAAGADLLAYFEIGNQDLFEHIDDIEQIFIDGQQHRGITYVWGPPGVGKSFITRDRLGERFPGNTCLVKVSDLFTVDSEQLSFHVTTETDLATLDGQITFNSLPAADPINDFELDSMLVASGCVQDGLLVPMIIIDDLDEVTSKTSAVILRSVDEFMLDVGESEEKYIHVFVFGRPEGFAPWFRDPRRHGGVNSVLREFLLGGPYVSSMGDLEVLAEDEYSFILGSETWQAMKADGTAEALVEDYVRYIARQPILPYSVRSLSIAVMIMDRVSAFPDDTEAELKAFLFEELMQRAASSHDRPVTSHDQYMRILEAIAVRNADEGLLDENGFFRVGAIETVPVTDSDGQIVGDVLVREVLDHSGIAYPEPASFTTPRYSFYPFWVHSHLVELNNQRLDEGHTYRACHA